MKNRAALITLLLILGVVSVQFSFGQTKEQKKEIKKIEPDAKEMYRVGEYNLAFPLYKKLDSLAPKNPEYNFRLGVCYLNSHEKLKALPYFERAKRFGYEDEKLGYYLGRSYHYSHYFDSAIQYYTAYKTHLEEKSGKDDEIAELNKFIEECTYGKALVKTPVDATIENLGPKVNSRHPEYGPVISADEEILIFTSKRPNSTGGELDHETSSFYEDMYISRKADKQWGEVEQLPSTVNSASHDASIGLSPDGQKLFVYRNNDHASERSGDIYVTNIKGNEWSVPERMPNPINTKGWEPSASITPDEKVIYFSSTREGGFGGTDIYAVRLLPSGEWAEPVNLGEKINTEHDEDGPFIHPDGKTLYFSSEGHRTIGGFDIFKTVYDEKENTWSTPENVGYPINTADNDVYYVLSADGLRAYFSSVREDSYGDADIYVAHLPEQSVPIIQFKGHVYRKDNERPVAATITVTDNETKQLVAITNSNSFNGRFTTILPPLANYNITVDLPHYLFYSENINVPDQVEYYEVSKEIYLEPLSTEGSISAMRNIFFLPGESEIRVESETELNNIYKKLSDDPDLEIEIAAHTDNMGDPMVNKLLSQARAQAIKDYLIAKGVDPNRVFAVGYGGEFPVADNESEEGRNKNRRVEVITIHGLAEGFLNDPETQGYYYRGGLSPFDESEAETGTAGALAAAGLPPNFKAGTKLDGVTVQFEFDDDKIQRDFYQSIDQVTDYMKKYPGVRFEVAGHTCNMGPSDYNQQLSERRVNSVVSYLSRQGVDVQKLIRRGYGEDSPLYPNDTRENRAKNRRVEFIMLEAQKK